MSQLSGLVPSSPNFRAGIPTSLTLDTYSHSIPALEAEAAAKVAALVFGLDRPFANRLQNASERSLRALRFCRF